MSGSGHLTPPAPAPGAGELRPDLDRPADRLADALADLAPVRAVPTVPTVPSPGKVTSPPVTGGIDWQVVVGLRTLASEKILESTSQWASDHARPMPEDDRVMMARSIIREVVRTHALEHNHSGQPIWSLQTEVDYVKAVHDAIFGYGRLQPVFEIAGAENIEINGWDHVMVHYQDGRRVPHPPVADSDEELVEAVRFLGLNSTPPRAFDDAHPMMTLAIGDRFRLHAIAFGLSHRPSVVIRQHLLTEVTLDDLAGSGMMPQALADLLRACVLSRQSVVISGDQGAGKTTMLRALIAAIPTNERIGTLETDYELLTHLLAGRGNVVALQSKVGLGEYRDGRRLGEYSVADLIPEALRQNLSRVIVGEVRGVEAAAMFEAMQSGAGTMSTTHSHSAISTMDRLAARAARGGAMSMDEAYRQIALNLDLLIHLTLVDDTWRGGGRRRFVGEVREITGALENGRPVTHLVYQADRTGRPGSIQPSPALMNELAWLGGRR